MKILSMPAGAAASHHIYENGAFNVGVDNPGAYTYTSGFTTVGATLQIDKFIATGAGSTKSGAIGTTNVFDFTNYNVLKVRCKCLAGVSNDIIVSSTQANANGSLLAHGGITSTSEHIVSIDVSSVTTAYLSFFAVFSGCSFEVYEIWVE